MIKQFTRDAVNSKALIVHSCGFDSVPSDLCTLLAVQKLKSSGNDVKVGKVISSFKMKGGPSGGTILTMLTAVGDKSSENQAVNRNPFALSPSAFPFNSKFTLLSCLYIFSV